MNLPRKIDAILFDVYGTLATWKPDRYTLHARAASKFGLNVTQQGVDQGYAAAEVFMTHQNTQQPIRSMTAEERDGFFARFEQIVLEGCGINVDLELADRIWHAVATQEYELALYDDVLDNLKSLRHRGFLVGVVSNVPMNSDQLIKDLELSSCVDFAVTSQEVGVEKPRRGIFNEALRRANGTPPAKALMVGDQLESDIDGALNAGINPVLLDRNNLHPDFADAPRFRGLAQLVSAIDD